MAHRAGRDTTKKIPLWYLSVVGPVGAIGSLIRGFSTGLFAALAINVFPMHDHAIFYGILAWLLLGALFSFYMSGVAMYVSIRFDEGHNRAYFGGALAVVLANSFFTLIGYVAFFRACTEFIAAHRGAPLDLSNIGIVSAYGWLVSALLPLGEHLGLVTRDIVIAVISTFIASAMLWTFRKVIQEG